MQPVESDTPAAATGSTGRMDDPQPNITLRLARPGDLPAILGLLADDAISAARGSAALEPTPAIAAAFAEIDADPSHELWVAEAGDGIVATLQLSFIPGLSRNGMRRAQVEAVRVRSDRRGCGIGARLMRQVIDRARERGCGLVQLTSDRRRDAAHRFYARLGFVDSHVGMKLALHRD